MEKTLAEAKNGEDFQIIDCLDMPKKCLIMLFGLAIGEIVRCVAKVDPIIIGKNKQTIAIGRKLTGKIYIQAA